MIVQSEQKTENTAKMATGGKSKYKWETIANLRNKREVQNDKDN
jgi:hypothetical protein